MHLPKYFNPHLTVDTTRIVSRKTLRLEEDADVDVEEGRDVGVEGLDRQEVEDLCVMLDKIVSKRLKLKRAFVPSDEPRSSKRHKTLAEEGKPAEPQQHSEPVSEFASSCLPQTSLRFFSLSFPFGIKIATPSCHLSHPKASQGYTVGSPLQHHHRFQGNLLGRLFPVSKNRLVKIQNKNLKSAFIVQPSPLSILNKSSIRSRRYAYSRLK